MNEANLRQGFGGEGESPPRREDAKAGETENCRAKPIRGANAKLPSEANLRQPEA